MGSTSSKKQNLSILNISREIEKRKNVNKQVCIYMYIKGDFCMWRPYYASDQIIVF